MVDGIFHSAHEVYILTGDGWAWLATFARLELATQYAAQLIGFGLPLDSIQVRPI
jgi:hypothetical protein